MSFPTITPLPDAPDRLGLPSVFSDAVDAFLTALPTMVTEENTAGAYIDQAVIDAATSETAAAASETAAAASATISQSNANFKGLWSNLTGALNIPASVYHSLLNWQLLNNLADVTASEPGATADWVAIDQSNIVIPHTGGGTLTALRINEIRDDDSGYLLPLANSVAANQTITINLPMRYATGAVITRSGSDTIEGLTSDTSITLEGSISITLTSDGSSEWTL